MVSRNGEDSGCGCVEVATNVVDAPDGMVAVRDTKTGNLLEFDRHEWQGFIAHQTAGPVPPGRGPLGARPRDHPAVRLRHLLAG